jgi:alpha-1,2-mannosyltransferase
LGFAHATVTQGRDHAVSTDFPSGPYSPLPRVGFVGSLPRWERHALFLGFAALLAFSIVVEIRSAFSNRPHTDLQVYLRAAWAVRTGEDLYGITDSNGWHFHYPPLLAIFLTPLADPTPGTANEGTAPFAVSVAVWYWFSVACLAWGVHTLCRALEQTSADPAVRLQPPACERWRAVRFLPVLVCLIPIGQTLARGQVNLLLFALLCGFIAAVVRGRRFQAGVWLAGAICLKIIPAFLLIYPLWKRDWRGLAGCSLGLVIGLGVIPSAILGPQRTLSYFEEWTDVLLRPALGKGDDHSRATELINVTATDSQAPVALLHNALYPDPNTRPKEASDGVRWGHRLIAVLLTVLTLLASGWSRQIDPRREALTLGALIIVMILASPVCHLHYFCLTLPLVIGIFATRMENVRAGRGIYALLLLGAANILCTILPVMPGMQIFRDHGSATTGALLIWGTGLVMLVCRRRARPAVTDATPENRVIAA